MAEFLDTTAVSYNIERLLKTAQERVVIISPYLKFRQRIRDLIEDASRRDVPVDIVYGKTKQCEEAERLSPLKDVQVLFCRSVHAKCYLNEQGGIITSLNLYDFSEAKNYEMGVLFRRSSDSDLYIHALEEAERLIRIAGGACANAVTDDATAAKVGESPPNLEKLTTAKLATKLGLTSADLYRKLIGRGYLELREGGQHYITRSGKTAGGEFRFSKGPFFLWPADLQI
jgi:phosphatidylserine/phosphatidylglycerophosphate/cardiolipin synthase-like enzyme